MEPIEPIRYVDPNDPRYLRADEQPYVQPVEPVMPVQPVTPVRLAPRAAEYAADVERGWRAWRAEQIVYLILGILETLLIIRVVLKLLAANPDAGFSTLIYGVTGPFVAPFQGVFPTPTSNGSVLEVAALLALIVYPLLAWLIVRLIEVGRRRPTYTA